MKRILVLTVLSLAVILPEPSAHAVLMGTEVLGKVSSTFPDLVVVSDFVSSAEVGPGAEFMGSGMGFGDSISGPQKRSWGTSVDIGDSFFEVQFGVSPVHIGSLQPCVDAGSGNLHINLYGISVPGQQITGVALVGYSGLFGDDPFRNFNVLFGSDWIDVGFRYLINEDRDTFDIDFDPAATPIPEPSTMLLFGGGLVSFAGYGRRLMIKSSSSRLS